MPFLSKVTITFNTHNDDRGFATLLHVFVKNRRNNSADPEENTDYIQNLLAYNRSLALGTTEINPYLAFGQALSNGTAFNDPSSHSFDLPLRSKTIKQEDVLLPVVNIHILPNGNDRWIFSYTITFHFDDGRSFSSASNVNGVKGIILDQDNRNYSGICTENPFITIPGPIKPQTNAKLTRVMLEFSTHDDNKNASTRVNAHITNRVNATKNPDIAIGLNMFPNMEFPTGSYNRFIWPSPGSPLASNSILLQDMVLPVINIIMVPSGNDRWIFDYKVTFDFDDGHSYSSQTDGIILDQDNAKYAGVYQGSPFPTLVPPTKPTLTHAPILKTKYISLSFLQKKLDEFINTRQGSPTSANPPMVKLRLHNTGVFPTTERGLDGLPIPITTLPESYFDLQSINAIRNAVEYISSPTTLGQLTGKLNIGNLYFNNIISKTITLNVDATSPTPLTAKIDFDCSGPQETVGGIGGMNFLEFSITLLLTLDYDSVKKRIDVMSWVNAIDKAKDDDTKNALMRKYIIVHLVTGSKLDPGGTFISDMTSKIYSKLTDADAFTKRTVRDGINSSVNTILLGGFIDNVDDMGVSNPNNNVVHSAQIQGDNLIIYYSGPQNIFSPAVPADWPNASTHPESSFDFSPGNLANIDHIVVLTMENRSFDHMLGYLSLPVSKGGMGRTDVDGLKGGEFNTYNGVNYPSFPLADTYFSPDPPHSYEPVNHAINGGKMDGFVKSYGDEHGSAEAGNIMGYQKQANIPVYDALVRDFSISHRWFAAHPGPTFCNRFYELSGRLNIDPEGFWEFSNSSSIRPSFTPTIFDHLNDYAHVENGITWKYFEHYYCFLRFFENYTFDNTNIVNADDPEFGFFACARNGTLPSVSFIDPHYVEFPPNANCDGPPADVKNGQALVQQVVEAVIASPNWNKTLLIVTYDEHGGFFDHVPPPQAVKVSDDSPISTHGVRTPAFFISPWVKQGGVFGHDRTTPNVPGQADDSLCFDHTSTLKTIARRFMSDYPPYMGARYAAAQDLSQVMENTMRQTQFLPFIRYNILFNASQKSLDVEGASTAPGTKLWQYDVNNTIAQYFSFEDAGDGFFYIRTHCGNLYITVDVPALVVEQGGGSLSVHAEAVVKTPEPILAKAATTATTATAAATTPAPYGIKQDVKYHAAGIAVLAMQNNPGHQKWKMTPANAISAEFKDYYIITNASFPDKQLQPLVVNQSGSAVVLGDPATGVLSVNALSKNAWKITSPLISDNTNLHATATLKS